MKTSPRQTEFQMYFDYFEDVSKIPPHRILASNRGERLGVLKVKIQVDVNRIHSCSAQRLLLIPPLQPRLCAGRYRGRLCAAFSSQLGAGYTKCPHGEGGRTCHPDLCQESQGSLDAGVPCGDAGC